MHHYGTALTISLLCIGSYNLAIGRAVSSNWRKGGPIFLLAIILACAAGAVLGNQ